MDSTNCDSGDKATLASHLREIKSLQILEFAYYTKFARNDETGQLKLYAFYTTDGLMKEFLMSVRDKDRSPGLLEMKPKNIGGNGWTYIAVLLPMGTYHIGFEGVQTFFVSSVSVAWVPWLGVP